MDGWPDGGISMHEVAPINPWVALAYLASGILFILALRGLSSPASSRRGNRFGMIGMTIAVVTTLITQAPWKSGDAANSYVGIDVTAMAEILGATSISPTRWGRFLRSAGSKWASASPTARSPFRARSSPF